MLEDSKFHAEYIRDSNGVWYFVVTWIDDGVKHCRRYWRDIENT